MKFNFKTILRILLVLSCSQAWGMNTDMPSRIFIASQNRHPNIILQAQHGQPIIINAAVLQAIYAARAAQINALNNQALNSLD